MTTNFKNDLAIGEATEQRILTCLNSPCFGNTHMMSVGGILIPQPLTKPFLSRSWQAGPKGGVAHWDIESGSLKIEVKYNKGTNFSGRVFDSYCLEVIKNKTLAHERVGWAELACAGKLKYLVQYSDVQQMAYFYNAKPIGEHVMSVPAHELSSNSNVKTLYEVRRFEGEGIWAPAFKIHLPDFENEYNYHPNYIN